MIDYSKEKDTIFVFLVDRSGSMNGPKMNMTRDALNLFIQSLPPGCTFEIVSFGSKFEFLSKKGEGFINNTQTVKNVKTSISQFAANMGGTGIYKPLDWAINQFPVENKPVTQKQGTLPPVTGKKIERPITASKKPISKTEKNKLKDEEKKKAQ